MKAHEIHPDDLIGAIRYRSQWKLYAGTIAEWIMDYASYDPTFVPETSSVVFRNNILTVSNTNVADFCDAMKDYEISADDISALVKRDGAATWPLSVVVDFDNMCYVNGFHEIALHEYLPPGWKGWEDVPLNYVPDSIRELWR